MSTIDDIMNTSVQSKRQIYILTKYVLTKTCIINQKEYSVMSIGYKSILNKNG